MNRKLMTTFAAVVLTLPLQGFAHHSAAQFNFTTPISTNDPMIFFSGEYNGYPGSQLINNVVSRDSTQFTAYINTNNFSVYLSVQVK